MKISAYIFLAFLFIILLFSVTAVLNFQLSKAVNEESAYVSASTDLIRNSNRFQRNLMDMVSGLRGYLLTGETYFVESYDSAAVENETILSVLRPSITDTGQAQLLKEIETLNNFWMDEYAEPLRQAKLVSHVSESNLLRFNKMYRDKFLTGDEKQIQLDLRNKFKAFSNREYAIRNARKQILSVKAERAKNISLILVIVSVATGLIIVAFLIRRVSGRIRSMVIMANDIASGNYEVAVKKQTGNNDELSDLERSLNHMADELSQNIGLLKKKNEELDQYAHIVSHDLKGPLRGISNVVSWIEEDHKHEVGPKVQEYLELIKNRIYRAEYFIEGILEYARTDKEQLPLEKVDIKQLLNEVIEAVAPRLGIRIHFDSALPVFKTEKLPLFQVFANLISNAAKYHHLSQGNIHIYHKEMPDRYEFFVADDGPGIEQKYFQKIFMAFQTLHERDSYESSGVGLAIVKKILDGRDENIRVESTVNKGSIFCFTWKKNKQ